jgi:hypothetical protein
MENDHLRLWLPPVACTFIGIILVLCGILIRPEASEHYAPANLASEATLLSSDISAGTATSDMTNSDRTRPDRTNSSSNAQSREFFHQLLLELGLACIVGAIVSITIEAYMRDQKKKEDRIYEERIHKNIFEALFETALPSELVAEMYKSLFVPKFIREQLEINFTFRHLTDEEKQAAPGDDLLVIQQTVKFNARNTTGRSVTHSVAAREYMLIDHPSFKAPFKEFRMKGSTEGDTVHLAGDTLASLVIKPTEDKTWYDLSRQSVTVHPNEYAHTCSVVEKVCRYEDTKTWITKYAASGLKLTVTLLAKDLYEALIFSVDQSHREELKKADSSAVKSPMSYQWDLNHPILPYQGIMLHWRKK